MLWVLVIVSIFAAMFAGWLTLLARANARRFPVPEPEEMLKKDADAMLIVLPALIAISSPHGGALHGKPSGSSNGILTFPNDGSSPDDIDGRNSPAVPRLRVLTTISRRIGSNEAPAQLPPPSELGNTRLGTMPYGVYGPDCTIVS